MNVSLRRVFLASLLRRRLATALSLLAIALGVALGLAVQLIHARLSHVRGKLPALAHRKL